MDFHYSVQEVSETAATLLSHITPSVQGATVVGLSGDLGAGKTTLVAALAKTLGVEDTVVSPTFVIAKFYELSDTRWDTLVHIDAYRIDDVSELEPLGWETMCATPRTLIVIEWPERITAALPLHTQRFSISHTDTGRHIKAL